ncbi:AhpC/TSA family protein [Mucilaginibacter rigui]|uniref:AhpC/TSA family protein n=1 Tax=Mucilaginibacter rigui TaxID=534635 RepID=A0ABR7X8I0_9SPHI|nr:TlpA disulfide reductase family protein [Mucilaginibacter rigui]MBD1386886.1 AhpC/TSA family protein [Mucilaginibacter rigui]
MKRCFLLLATLLPLLAFAQKPFTIAGDVKPFKNGDRVYLSYRENGKLYIDSTIVNNGYFKFSGSITGLGIGYICRNDSPLTADILHDAVTLYIQPGNISVTTQDSLRYATIEGTPLNKDNTELELALKPLTKKHRAIADKYDTLTPQQQADVTFTDPIKVATDAILKQMEPIKFSFIKSHPDSYISLLTLDRMINHADFSLVADAYNSLSVANKTSALGKTMEATINSAKQSQVGVMAANFELTTATGRKVKLADFKGKYVLIDFWASWCLPCRQENPNVVAAFKKYNSKKFTVLSISIDSKSGRLAWLQAIKTDKLPWTQAIDHYNAAASVKNLYGVTTIPANVLIDPTGKIVAKNIKGLELHQTLAGLLGN